MVATGRPPALALLVHRVPGRQVRGHQPPRRARSDQPTQAVADLPQALVALGSLVGYAGQIGGSQRPFILAHITGVGFTFHTASVASKGLECITPSSLVFYCRYLMISYLLFVEPGTSFGPSSENAAEVASPQIRNVREVDALNNAGNAAQPLQDDSRKIET